MSSCCENLEIKIVRKMENETRNEIIDVNNCILVEQPDGRIIQTDDGTICLQNKSDGQIFFVQPSDEICQRFNLQWEHMPNTSNESRSEPDEQITKTRPIRWSKEAILTLINLRIAHDQEFKSTTTKNEVIWKKIAEELKAKGFNMTINQCNDKWRYLKARYTARKDNMGDKGTGEAPCQFAYFDVMDSFLGHKHNIRPESIASSIQGDTMPEEEPDSSHSDQDTDMEPPQQKKKKMTSEVTQRMKSNKTALQKIMEELKQSRVERDNNRERRHQEIMNLRNNAVSVFSAKMDALIETLKK